MSIPIEYQGVPLGEGFRADLIVEGKVLLELKSVEHLTALHRKQIQTYLRLTGLELGLLLNFGAALMKDAIVRCVNGREERCVHSRGKNIARRNAKAQRSAPAIPTASLSSLFFPFLPFSSLCASASVRKPLLAAL